MASVVASVTSGIVDTVVSSLRHIRGGENTDSGEQLYSVFIPDQKEQRDSNFPQSSEHRVDDLTMEDSEELSSIVIQDEKKGSCPSIPQSLEHRIDDVIMEVSEKLSSIFIPDEKKECYPSITQENSNELVKKDDVDSGEKFCIILIPEEKEECDLHIPQDADSLKPEFAFYMNNMEMSEDNSRSQDAETLNPEFSNCIDMEEFEDNSLSQDAEPLKSEFSIYLDFDMEESEDKSRSQVGGDVAESKTCPSSSEILNNVKENIIIQVGGDVAESETCPSLFEILKNVEEDIIIDRNEDEDEELMSMNIVARIWKDIKVIKVEFANSLVCWTPWKSVSPDFLRTVLGRHNPWNIRDMWVRAPGGFPSALFSGLIAEFENETSVWNAAKELFLVSEEVQTIQLNSLLTIFSQEEESVGKGPTTIVVSGKKLPSCDKDVRNYLAMLKSLGRVLSFFFYPQQDGVLVPIFRATFAFATQAYAAKLYLEGYQHRGAGHLRVEVQEGSREQEICRRVKRSLVDFMESWSIRK